jgi:hypothetical protein
LPTIASPVSWAYRKASEPNIQKMMGEFLLDPKANTGLLKKPPTKKELEQMIRLLGMPQAPLGLLSGYGAQE